MLICKECGASFDEGECGSSRELVGYMGSAPAYVDYSTCPYCGSDDIDDAVLCSVCDEWVDKDITVETDEGYVCDECRKSVKIRFDSVASNVFNAAEIAVLREIEEEGGLL